MRSGRIFFLPTTKLHEKLNQRAGNRSTCSLQQLVKVTKTVRRGQSKPPGQIQTCATRTISSFEARRCSVPCNRLSCSDEGCRILHLLGETRNPRGRGTGWIHVNCQNDIGIAIPSGEFPPPKCSRLSQRDIPFTTGSSKIEE